MQPTDPRIQRARDAWRWRGADRPDFAIEPKDGEESVWDYPRPPSVEAVSARVRVELDGVTVVDSRRAVRVLETASGPAIYVPFDDVRMDCMQPTNRGTVCEWKGPWIYWNLQVGSRRVPQAAWSYTDPWAGFEALTDCLSFYPAKVDACRLGEERVEPQPGGFYGGWVTPNIVGPMKGGPGTGGW